MNINIPILHAHVSQSFITAGQKDGSLPCVIFGASSLKGYAVLFHCQIACGAVYYRLPVSAFRTHSDGEKHDDYTLEELQPWDASSYDAEVIIYDWLFKQTVECLKLRNSKGTANIKGTYLFTFDWFGKWTTAEISHEHKCLHMIELRNGQYALQPNNYLLWHEKSNVKVDGSHQYLRPNLTYPTVE